jgi:photosystem II stability/assembly factor-like uncharacterized protein
MKKLFLILVVVMTCGIYSTKAEKWIPTNGPWGVYAKSIYVSKKLDLYIQTDDYKTYKSTDDGNNWSVLENVIRILAEDSLGNIYASITGKGLCKSSNGALNWDILTAMSVNRMICHPDGSLFVISGELLRSDDDGITWTQKFEYLIDEMALAPDGKLYIGTQNSEVYESSDKGDSWQKIYDLGSILGIRNLVVSPLGSLFTNSVGSELYKSDNTDLTWSKVQFNGESNFIPYCVAINNKGEIVATDVEGKALLSTDDGVTWINRTLGFPHNAISIFASPKGDFYCGTTGLGVYKLPHNALSWSRLNNHINLLTTWSIAYNGTNCLLAGTDKSGVYISTDKGENWITGAQADQIQEPGVTELMFSNNNRAYACGTISGLSNSNCYYSQNNGIQWFKIPTLENIMINQFFDLNNNQMLAGTTNGIYSSSDLGSSWIKSESALDQLAVRCLAKDSLGAKNGIFISLDNAVSWNPVNNGIDSMNISSIAVSSKDDIYATPFFGGIYKSTNQGQSWTKIFNGYDGSYPVSITVIKDDIYLLDVYKGLFKSTDDGNSWELVVENIAADYQAWLSGVFDEKGVYYVCGQTIGGIYKSEHSLTPVVELITTKSNIEIYPNPAHDYFNIENEFNNSVKNQHKIIIYNISGEKVIECPYNNRIDISKLVPGIYLISVGIQIRSFVKI